MWYNHIPSTQLQEPCYGCFLGQWRVYEGATPSELSASGGGGGFLHGLEVAPPTYVMGNLRKNVKFAVRDWKRNKRGDSNHTIYFEWPKLKPI